MKAPVEDQLRAYFAHLDHEQEAVDIAAIAAQSPPERPVLDVGGPLDGLTEGRPPQVELVVDSSEVETMKLKPSTLLVLVAAAVIVIAGVFLAIESGSDDSAPVVTDDVPAVSPEEFADGFIQAWSSGDADAVLAALTADVVLSEKYTGMSSAFEAMDLAFFERHVAWTTAQGTIFLSPECTEDGVGAQATANVSCEFGWLNAAERAADATPVPTALDLVITPEGISQLAFEYPPRFGVASFDSWLDANHPDDAQGVEFGEWSSVAEAREGGILRARYAEEWAAERAARLADLDASGDESGDS